MATTKAKTREPQTPVAPPPDAPVQPPVDEAALIAEQTTAAPVAPANIDLTHFTEQQADEYERLVAEQKATRERIKQLKAAQPKVSALEKVYAAQRASVPLWTRFHNATRLYALVNAGEDFETALAFVLGQLKECMRDDVNDRVHGIPNPVWSLSGSKGKKSEGGES